MSPFILQKIISSSDLISHLQGEKNFRTKELFTLVENCIITHVWKIKRINSCKKNIPTCQPWQRLTTVTKYHGMRQIVYLLLSSQWYQKHFWRYFFLKLMFHAARDYTVCSISGQMLYWFVLALISLRSQHLFTPVMKPEHRPNKPHCQGETGLHWGSVIRKGSPCFQWGLSEGRKGPLVSSSSVLRLKARCYCLQSYLL